LINGWDVVEDNNTKLSVMGRVGLYPDAQTSIGVVGFVGPEQPIAADPTQANRYGIDVLANHKFGSKINAWVQWDYGQEKANPALPDPTQDAKWWGIGGWLTYDFTPKVAVALRADYVDDEQGARTSNFHFPANLGNQFGSGTVTLNLRTWPNLLVRPEVRYDSSSLNAYDGNKNQVTFAASAAYLF
jgi:maltoporin